MSAPSGIEAIESFAVEGAAAGAANAPELRGCDSFRSEYFKGEAGPDLVGKCGDKREMW